MQGVHEFSLGATELNVFESLQEVCIVLRQVNALPQLPIKCILFLAGPLWMNVWLFSK